MDPSSNSKLYLIKWQISVNQSLQLLQQSSSDQVQVSNKALDYQVDWCEWRGIYFVIGRFTKQLNGSVLYFNKLFNEVTFPL